jgi:hypothetical protein
MYGMFSSPKYLTYKYNGVVVSVEEDRFRYFLQAQLERWDEPVALENTLEYFSRSAMYKRDHQQTLEAAMTKVPVVKKTWRTLWM